MTNFNQNSSIYNTLEQNSVEAKYKAELRSLEEAYKSGHISTWAYIQILMDKVENYTNEVKNGWGKATYWSQELSSDISSLKTDIAEMQKWMQDHSGEKIPNSYMKKFASDYKKIKSDFTKFYCAFLKDDGKGHFVWKNVPDPSMKQMIQHVYETIHGMGSFTGFGHSKNLDEQLSSGHFQDLRDFFSWEPKALDKFLDGDGYPGLTSISQEVGYFSTEGTRALTKYETIINTMNNVGVNCVKSQSDLMQTIVRNQISQ